MRTLILTVCLALLAGPGFGQTLSLKGPAGQTAALTTADIAALDQVTVTLDEHGAKHSYKGPLLSDVLRAVHAPHGELLHGAAAADVVVVRGSDGYVAVMSLAEADPSIRANQTILATQRDGAPLDAKSGPYRLVIEGDLKPVRSARMVTSIEVVSLAASKP